MRSLLALAASLVVLGACFLAPHPVLAADGEQGARLLRHVVLFKFKADAPADQIKEVEAAFAALPSKVDAVADLEWGREAGIAGRNQGFTHCFFVSFKCEAGRAAYLPHPAHKKFVELIKPIIGGVCVVDYWQNVVRQPELKQPLRHLALFDFKDDASPQDLTKIETAVEDMVGKIDHIAGAEWGVNNSPEGLNQGYTHCLTLTFADKDALAKYGPHPEHARLKDITGPQLEGVLVFDYLPQ